MTSPTDNSLAVHSQSLIDNDDVPTKGSLVVEASSGIRAIASPKVLQSQQEIMTRIRLKWNTSRGMPPIFGFFGKVTAKGKKALLNSFVLLIINLIFLTGCAFAFVSIENNEKYRSKAIGKYLGLQGDFKYFLNKTHDPNDEDGIPHLPGMTPWDEDRWAELKGLHGTRCFKLDNVNTQKNLWNFWSSLDFCATVLTTIGYGSMSPRTHAGKWFTLCYSVVGIPIMAMYLALFSKGIVAFLSASINLFSTIMSKVNRQFELRDMTTRVFSLFVLLLALIVFICMWSAILNNSNPTDSFVKCMYFYVITLTTVGLGDISMTEANHLVLIRVLFVFCIGLTLVTSVFNAIRSVSAAHTRMLKAKGRKLTSKAQEVVMDGANKLMRHTNNTNNGDGQTDLLTKDDDMENGQHEMVETTFMAVDEENAGFNSSNHYNNHYS
ncbi:uncoordinated protein 58-like isoform X3 [Bolinopsis microptera]|uniref:uncoordinated protein 58-like isoform X3 n=1 Tax=Bolinopsis microptera TaxID=2820187 RepID=UPI00307A4268